MRPFLFAAAVGIVLVLASDIFFLTQRTFIQGMTTSGIKG